MPQPAPGRSHREGLSIFRLTERFPDEDSARRWFENVVWPDGRYCPRCGSVRTHEAGHGHMPYRCRDCRSYFSVKTGTAIEKSKVSLRKWVFAIYLELTSLKGISSMKLHREIEVTQKTAWFMLHRIREGIMGSDDDDDPFTDAVEADETFVGGYVRGGQGGRGKSAVAGEGVEAGPRTGHSRPKEADDPRVPRRTGERNGDPVHRRAPVVPRLLRGPRVGQPQRRAVR